MEIIKVIPRGYCKGVTNAISIAKKSVDTYPDKAIFVLGMLVHNAYVIEALKALNIHTIDDKSKTRLALLDEIPAHSVVIFTAHGIAPDVIQKAKQKSLICIDASCSDVVKTQTIVKDKLDEGYEILYIGKKQHPEAEAVCSLSEHVHLLTSKQELHLLPIYQKVFVTNQTTMSIFDVENIFSQIKAQYPNALFSEEICNATRIRQQAVVDLKDKKIDVLYVVGDIHSNNSTRLAQIAKEQNIPNVYLIDDVGGICDEQIAGMKRIAVTSGASTPTYLTSQVIQYLSEYPNQKEKPTILLKNIL